MTLKWARILYPPLVGALVVIYYAVPSVRPGTAGAVGVLGIGGIAFGLLRWRPERWPAWLLIAVAVALLAVGDVLFNVLARTRPGPVAFPDAPDVFYLSAYVPLATGLFWLGRSRYPSWDWAMLLDSLALGLAGSLLVWVELVRPAVTSLHLAGAGKATAIASWVGFVAVLTATARIVLAWRTNLSLALLGSGVLAFLIADFFYGEELIGGSWTTGSPVDLGFLAFSVLCGAAALTPSMGQIASAGYARHQLGPVRLAMLAAGLLVGPALLLADVLSGRLLAGAAIAVVSAVVGVIMLVRLSLSAQEYRRRANREHAVRVASRALVVATTEEGVLDGLRAALAVMVRTGDPHDVTLGGRVQRHGGGPTLRQISTEQTGLADRGVGELILPVRPEAVRKPIEDPTGHEMPGEALVYRAKVAELTELSPVLEALTDQAGSALERVRLMARLRTEERERYFRTLVLASTEVTLISRHGRIDYATPSARALFGHDVVGESFDVLVRRMPPDDDQDEPVPSWSDDEDNVEGSIQRPGGSPAIVLVHRRDLSAEPTVNGVVTTLRDVTAERNLQRRLAYRASHDSLTGLANSQTFGEELRRDAAPEAGHEAPVGGRAALFIDVDDFKAINDTYGHEVGDQLLAEVARRIESCLSDEDLAARLGGDEFAVLLRGLSDEDTARVSAQRIADTLTEPISTNGTMVDCQASIGLAYTAERGELDSLLREADTALYTAKAHGKGRWREYREGMPTPTRRYIDARRRIQNAVNTDKLALHYQPIVELATGRAIGFEALIRLIDNGEPMSALELISAAEDTGLINTIGDWVLRRALTDAVTINQARTENRRYVSVNVSARQLRQPDFADIVRAHIASTGADPALLVLEITENLLIGDDERAWAFLDGLRRQGTRVAIDDYGTGYASLSYLRQPGIDIVKIDQSFLTDVSSPRGRILLHAVCSVCANLGLDSIAEGVHDATSRDVLLQVGCTYGQGFFYARPMPIDEALSWG